MPETSKYEAGDYVVYKYSGSYRAEPVMLTERVLAKNGNKLEILVEWKSGKEVRTWKQYVTDTAFNRKNNIVDRLVQLSGGKELELPNPGNMDLLRLYEGTFLLPQHVPKLIREENRPVALGKASYPCRIRTYKTKVLGKHVDMTVTDSEEFKWSNVGSSYRDTLTGLPVYTVEVTDHGNKGTQ